MVFVVVGMAKNARMHVNDTCEPLDALKRNQVSCINNGTCNTDWNDTS
jgi:hypothetical protein